MTLRKLPFEDPHVVAVIPKSHAQEIRVTIGRFSGQPLLSIRTFFKNNDEWQASKFGIAIPLDLVPEFAAAVAQARVIASKGMA